jgi:hypothetical protein
MSKSKNIRRIANILSGDFRGKAKTSVGYSKVQEDHKEGDVWEENGKTWTIKNGVTKTVSKLSRIRTYAKVPFACECGQTLRHMLDKKAYTNKGKCYTCLLKEETKYRVDGTFKKYSEDKRKANIESWMKDAEIEYKDMLENIDSQSFVTEDGHIEDWGKGTNTERLRKQFDGEMKAAQSILDGDNDDRQDEKSTT